jgi:hypothetical protein
VVPGPGAPPLVPVDPGTDDADTLFPAKVKVLRARVVDGKLDLLVGITGRASGDLEITYRAAGKEIAFTEAIGDAKVGERLIKIRRELSDAQRRLGTGIVEIAFAGNQRTQPDEVRMRAAGGRSLLKRTELELDGRELTVAGTVSSRVEGIVRLRVVYADGDGIGVWNGRARIDDGKWSLTRDLPAAAVADPRAYLTGQFTGDFDARGGPHRGEQFGKGL